MAKALFLGMPAHGHVTPTLALTGELVRRGEEVVYYATDEFRPVIENVGATFRPYAVTPEYKVSEMENAFRVMELLLRYTVDMMPEVLQRVAAEKPDYILHDAMAVWGKIAARLLGIPAIATMPFFAARNGKSSGSWRFDLEVLRMLLAAIPSLVRSRPLIKRLRDEYGRNEGFLDLFHNAEPLVLVFTSKYFQANADAYDSRFRFVGPQLESRPELADFPFERIEGKRLIYISLGTVYNESLSFWRACLDAFGGMDYAVVLAIGAKIDPGALEPIPGNCIVRSYVPQLKLLERASLFITHGGMNSATEGMYHGVPLIVVPQGVDQLLVACRVAQLGAGVYLNRRKVTPARLRDTALRAIDDPDMRRNGQKVRDSFQACGGFREAADAVIRFAQEHPRPRKP